MRKISSRAKALAIASSAEDKKCEDLLILDIRKVSDISDFFVICSGSSKRHVLAISDGINEALKKKRLSCYNIEGYEHGLWIILDYIDVVAHIFYKETREFYSLETLWGDAKKVSLPKKRRKSKSRVS